MIDNDFDRLWRFLWVWCDCYDGCDCDHELLCSRLRKTMMMMMIYVCICIRYKYVCVHYQFLSSYWLKHMMIYSCSSTTLYTTTITISLFLTSSHYYPFLPSFLPSHLFLCVLFLIVRLHASPCSMWDWTWEYRTGTVTV